MLMLKRAFGAAQVERGEREPHKRDDELDRDTAARGGANGCGEGEVGVGEEAGGAAMGNREPTTGCDPSRAAARYSRGHASKGDRRSSTGTLF